MPAPKSPNWSILLWSPNVVGYIRIVLLAAAFPFLNTDIDLFLTMLTISLAMDALDGFLARRFSQSSQFGAAFDVFIDILSRSLLWCHSTPLGCLVVTLEWATFLSLHHAGPLWKKLEQNRRPALVSRIMANNFRQPAGIYALTGIFVLPTYLCVHQAVEQGVAGRWGLVVGLFQLFRSVLGGHFHLVLCCFLAAGRLLGCYAELWYVWCYVKCLLMEKAG